MHDEFFGLSDIPPPDPVNAVFEEVDYAQDDRSCIKRRN